MNQINLSFQKAKPLIKEADLLFVKGTQWFSPLIKWWTKSEYSHVALASWFDSNQLDILEFTTLRGGGASVNYENYFPKYSGKVDVFRPDTQYQERIFNPQTDLVETKNLALNARAITNDMRALTGLSYGYWRLWKMFTKLFSISVDNLTKQNNHAIIYPVCSTSIAYVFEKNGFLLLRHKNYEWMCPGDLSMSPTLNYMFTII